jgi:hypothetical protein
MNGENDLKILLKAMKPKIHSGEYVFCMIPVSTNISYNDVILFFKEEEGNTVILKKEVADKLKLDYSFIASWITLTVHSSLDAVGLTAAFSKALSDGGISCNVVAAYYHDHIFVDRDHAKKALQILNQLSD